ncbi:hypothetical protein LTR10_015922 [Elasticomyces elasticus]|nr:hypothetical protein LTR10_015922 [Elasticomyces elasticus]KAK4974622.1 hypothetical protein LTR42_005268 [Elasticomyces elasticus]
MPNLDTIAPELRLHIYEHALSFDTPLKRTLFDRLRITTHHNRDHPPAIVNTALLRVCRMVYEEALPVFYKLNSIWICHTDVCLSTKYARTSLSCTQSLLVHARLTQDPHACNEGGTIYSCFIVYTPRLLQHFTGPAYPRLRSLTIESPLESPDEDLGWPITYEETVEHLRNSDVEVTYTGITRFTAVLAETTGHRQSTITIQCGAAAAAADRMFALSRAELAKASLQDTFSGMGKRVFEVCYAFARAHAQLPLQSHQYKTLKEGGLRREDFDGSPFSPAMYERMTSVF